MSQYRIITDSCCDLTKAQYAQLDVSYASLSVHFGTDSHANFTEPEELQEFYNRLRAGEFPGTSGVNPSGWKDVMKPILEAGQDILCVAFSSNLSTTCQSALIAAQELGEKYPCRTIRVVDSLCFSMGQALLVWHACRNRNLGMSLEENAQWCEDNKLHICQWLVVDSLEHLKRGGRIDAKTAFVGGMLRVKPLFYITDEGKFSAPQKARGWKGAMDTMLERFRNQSVGFDNHTICIGHGDNPAHAEQLAERFRRECGVQNVILSYIGGVIGTHTGPGTLSVYYMGQSRE